MIERKTKTQVVIDWDNIPIRLPFSTVALVWLLVDRLGWFQNEIGQWLFLWFAVCFTGLTFWAREHERKMPIDQIVDEQISEHWQEKFIRKVMELKN